MKTQTIFLFCLTTLKIAYTQEFGSKNARWVYNYDGTWSKGVTIMQYRSDSIIDGIPTRIYKKEGLRFIRRDSSTLKFDLKPIYIRSIDGIVTTSEDAIHFDTLYNFKANIGRTWFYTTHYPPNPWGNDTISMTIWDTFRVSVSGHDLFAQTVRFNNKNFTDYVDTVYENIGAKRHYILPFDEEEVSADGGEGGHLRCFYDNSIGLAVFNKDDIQNWYSYDCETLSTTENKFEAILDIRIFENPFVDILNISNLTHYKKQFKVFNIHGNLLYEDVANPGLNQVELSRLHSGMLYIIFENKTGFKIIKL